MTDQHHRGHLAGTVWNPELYEKFSDHRTRPGMELLDRVQLHQPELIYDLGCGSGEITRSIAERWPDARIVGIDNSREMLARAAANGSGIDWIEGDIRIWIPDAAPDLIYANASLQWIDGHEQLFPRLIESLAPGGTLAVQMPQNWPAPSHRLMRETLWNGGPNGAPIGPESLRTTLSRNWVSDPSTFYDLLAPQASHIDIWSTEYLQVLHGDEPVLDWVSGTGLRPIVNGLDDDAREVFLDSYRQRLQGAYPRRANGETLFPFKRLFIIAKR